MRNTPAIGDLTLPNEDIETPSYRAIVGSLQYAASGTRPDIAFATSALGKFNHRNNYQHLKSAKSVLRYLKRTLNYGITYNGQNCEQEIELECYCDSDFANAKDDRKSISGYAIKMAGGPIIWGSKRQTVTTQSSAEAELIAASTASNILTWTTNILEEIGIKVKKPVIINCGNQATIKIAQSEGLTPRTKHIDIRYFYIRDQIESGNQELKYVQTTENQADLLTKVPARDRFKKLREALNVEDSIKH
jgi:hypothetical protein